MKRVHDTLTMQTGNQWADVFVGMTPPPTEWRQSGADERRHVRNVILMENRRGGERAPEFT